MYSQYTVVKKTSLILNYNVWLCIFQILYDNPVLNEQIGDGDYVIDKFLYADLKPSYNFSKDKISAKLEGKGVKLYKRDLELKNWRHNSIWLVVHICDGKTHSDWLCWVAGSVVTQLADIISSYDQRRTEK